MSTFQTEMSHTTVKNKCQIRSNRTNHPFTCCKTHGKLEYLHTYAVYMRMYAYMHLLKYRSAEKKTLIFMSQLRSLKNWKTLFDCRISITLRNGYFFRMLQFALVHITKLKDDSVL